MGRTSARRKQSARPAGAAGSPTGTSVADGEVPVVGMREPCPCGSGKRYKACHGREAARAATRLVLRPFEGLSGEGDWVALREVVPAATAPLTLTGEHAGRDVLLATVLPMAFPALVRADGQILLALQTATGSGDPSRDAADALLRALAAEPGTPIPPPDGLPGPGPRLQDLLDVSVPLDVTVHAGFDFWIDADQEQTPDVAASLERANEAAIPTARLASVESAYWCRIGSKCHLRWAMPQAEEKLLDGLARLHAAGGLSLGGGTRFVGSFRADGVLVPVWDLPVTSESADVEEPAVALAGRLEMALASSEPLTADERRSRSGLLNRQLTLR